MRKTLSIYSILLIIALISAGVGAVSAKDVMAGTVTNVPMGTNVPVNISIHDANLVDAFGIYVVYDSNVMKVTGSSSEVAGWGITVPTANQGNLTTGGYPLMVQNSLTGDYPV